MGLAIAVGFRTPFWATLQPMVGIPSNGAPRMLRPEDGGLPLPSASVRVAAWSNPPFSPRRSAAEAARCELAAGGRGCSVRPLLVEPRPAANALCAERRGAGPGRVLSRGLTVRGRGRALGPVAAAGPEDALRASRPKTPHEQVHVAWNSVREQAPEGLAARVFACGLLDTDFTATLITRALAGRRLADASSVSGAVSGFDDFRGRTVVPERSVWSLN